VDQLVDNPWAKLEEKSDPLIPTGTLQIYQYIADYLKRDSDNNVNRASAANMCPKRRWYQRKGFEGEAITPRKMLNFLFGDLVERVQLFFIGNGCVGPGKLYSEVDFGESLGSIQFQGKDLILYKQKSMSFEFNGLTVTGHADGFGKRNSDGLWELIEIKSASDFGYENFKKKGPEDYLRQSHALMMMNESRLRGVKSVRFFFQKKSTGHTWDQLHKWVDDTGKKVLSDYMVASGEQEPVAPYDFVEKKGKKALQWYCEYCPYKRPCKGEFELKWKPDRFGNLRPEYIFADA
jgi:hypothetical protein